MPENWGWRVRNRSLLWASRPLPEAPPNWAQLQLVLGGVCGTDWQLLSGYAAFEGFLGHEFVASVSHCADATWLGRLVVGEINVGCGVCADCLGGDSRFCPARRVLGIRDLDGAFSLSFQLPLGNLFPVDDLPPELSVWCEPLAAALDVHQYVRSGDEVLVVGDGRLGSLIALSLQASHGVTLLGRHPHKLKRLCSLGLAAVDRVTGQWPAVVEATGSAQGLATALQLCRPRGTVVLKSTVAHPESIDTTPLVVNALRLVGSRCGRFGPALEALRCGHIDPRPLVDATLELAELPQALQRRDWVKVLIKGPQSTVKSSRWLIPS